MKEKRVEITAADEEKSEKEGGKSRRFGGAETGKREEEGQKCEEGRKAHFTGEEKEDVVGSGRRGSPFGELIIAEA